MRDGGRLGVSGRPRRPAETDTERVSAKLSKAVKGPFSQCFRYPIRLAIYHGQPNVVPFSHGLIYHPAGITAIVSS